jgi:dipeptide/tripeptide permease
MDNPLLVILVAPILAVTGATLMSRGGKTRSIGIGMIAGVVVVLAGFIINRLAAQ